MTDDMSLHLAPYRERGTIPCECACRVAAACGTSPAAVGRAVDALGIKVSECQLGLFGYEAYGEKRWTRRLGAVPQSLEVEIRAACAEGRLPCAAAWDLAGARGLPRLVVGSVAETLGLRIAQCQLGCFE
jgi:hypothetical protein